MSTRCIEGACCPINRAKNRFLFDYGDGREFLVELVKRKPKEPKIKLPRLLVSAGEAPAQHPGAEE